MIEENIDVLIKVYLRHCQLEKRLSQNTIKAYRIDLTQFSCYMDTDITACNKGQIQDYLSFLHNRYQIKSVKRKIASLKAFYTYLVDENIIDTNPFDKLRIKLHEPFILPRTISLNTISLILQYAYKNSCLVIVRLLQHRFIHMSHQKNSEIF